MYDGIIYESIIYITYMENVCYIYTSILYETKCIDHTWYIYVAYIYIYPSYMNQTYMIYNMYVLL